MKLFENLHQHLGSRTHTKYAILYIKGDNFYKSTVLFKGDYFARFSEQSKGDNFYSTSPCNHKAVFHNFQSF